jgi:hypothetical protein
MGISRLERLVSSIVESGKMGDQMVGDRTFIRTVVIMKVHLRMESLMALVVLLCKTAISTKEKLNSEELTVTVTSKHQ